MMSAFRRGFVLSLTLVSASAFAMKPKSYQLSGPVVALSETTITIEKTTGERVVLGRDAITRTNGGDLKVGDRVTVSYVLSADNIEINKSAKAAKAPAAADDSITE